jgi:2-aminoethylphosphonate transport system permease protein
MWLFFAATFGAVVVAPIAILTLAGTARSWTGVLPTDYTLDHLRGALSGVQVASLLVSIQTAALAGLLAVAAGSWAALALPAAPRWLRRVLDAFLHMPVAVPSVVVGLGLLVAFSQRPLLLNGTRWIVLIAHAVLVVAFAYSTVSAAVVQTDPIFAHVAASLGAAPGRVLWRIRLPMLLPAIGAATSLSVALSMGEVGATIMVYPPDWRTLPVTIFTLTDRGNAFDAAADTLVLLAASLVVLTVLGRLTGGWAAKRSFT